MENRSESQQIIINANYELFVLAVTCLSLVNGFLLLALPGDALSRQVIVIVEYVICAFLLADFFYRLLRARVKRHYLIKYWGWLDFIGSLPVPLLRIARLARSMIVNRTMQRTDLRKMGLVVVNHRAQSTLLAVVFIALVIFEISGIVILKTEAQDPQANIKTAGDALWWAYVTVATVGYGDRYPVTPQGRIVGIFVMTAGVGLFSVMTSFLADWFRRPRRLKDGVALQEAGEGQTEARVRLQEIQELLEQYEASQQQTISDLKARLAQLEEDFHTRP